MSFTSVTVTSCMLLAPQQLSPSPRGGPSAPCLLWSTSIVPPSNFMRLSFVLFAPSTCASPLADELPGRPPPLSDGDKCRGSGAGGLPFLCRARGRTSARRASFNGRWPMLRSRRAVPARARPAASLSSLSPSGPSRSLSLGASRPLSPSRPHSDFEN